jgi:hypothetical protein
MNAAPTTWIARYAAPQGPLAGSTHLVVKGQPRTPCGISVVMMSSRTKGRSFGSSITCATCAQATR